jgi:hypothetical protein
MLVNCCPRCQSVARIGPSANHDYAMKGGMRCHWCGYSFHSSEMGRVEVPGPEPEPKRREKPDPSPFLFDVN